MATEGPLNSETSMTTLVTGIIHDVQDPMKQQMTLLKVDLRNDLRQTKEAMTSLVIGGIVVGLGGILLSLVLVHALHEGFGLPLWGSHAIVGGLITTIGLTLVYAGTKRLQDLNPLPEQSVEAMKENVRWETRNSTTTPTPSVNR